VSVRAIQARPFLTSASLSWVRWVLGIGARCLERLYIFNYQHLTCNYEMGLGEHGDEIVLVHVGISAHWQ